jgi:penicillin amidase
MPPGRTRRSFLAALVGGGTAAAALSPADTYLDRLAPLSGTAWGTVGAPPETVDSPYGTATVTYDEYHEPHVEASTERAAYFAVGYVHAADRLFQMDLLRRMGGGRLSAVVGEETVERDVAFTKLDMVGGAKASSRVIEGTDAATMLSAYTDGVNAYADDAPPGIEFGLLEHSFEEWSVVDSLLVAQVMSWRLTGGFGPLREEAKRQVMDRETYRTLFPERLDHDVPIVRDAPTGGTEGGKRQGDQRSTRQPGRRPTRDVDPAFVDWLANVEPETRRGSNAWMVSGDVTEGGAPMVCNDPHLGLRAPPIWYGQQVSAGDHHIRGNAIPGVPFVVIGENDHGAWGITNVGADVLDCYTYETDGDRYRYRGEWREFETETRTVPVSDGDDREVTVKKTVHGPFVEREIAGETHHVGVSWTGLTGTREAQAFYELGRAEGLAEARQAIRLFDVPTQNFHYVDTDGRTLYKTVGKIPVRRIDGEVVPGGRVFDGSAGEAEWTGYEPFGQSSWEGFVPFEEKPEVVDADYVASANQRVVDDPAYPIARSFSDGFRAERIYERLDRTVGSGETIDSDDLAAIQLDSLDVRARTLVPAILDVRDDVPAAADDWLDALADWDYRLTRDSEAALFFQRFVDQFEAETWGSFFEDRGLDESYWPSERVLLSLPADSRFFDGDRASAVASAVTATVEELEAADVETYGDHNLTRIDHPLGGVVSGLNYPRLPTDGGPDTVRSFGSEASWGASLRMVADLGGESRIVVPGGNDGSPLSDHYHDQLRLWADGEYRTLDDRPEGDPAIEFEEGDG